MNLAEEIKKFDAAWQKDIGDEPGPWADTWIHLKRRLTQGALHDMQFHSFLGIEHLEKLYAWIENIHYPNFIENDDFKSLCMTAENADRKVFNALGSDISQRRIDKVGLYNAQDYYFQHALPAPDRHQIKTFLDFGAGHGRQANLWHTASGLDCFISLDAITATYLTQRLYYKALDLRVNDYIDAREDFSIEQENRVVNHLPSWRFDLVPDGSVDMICCVQVLRELSKSMLLYALENFHRVLRDGGAIYIRDHIGFHNVNQVDLDALLRAHGFCLEWSPHWVDRQDVHGVPRIWRKADMPSLIGGLK